MKILIPMTGYGSRFKNAGYSVLKPFIEVHGKPIISWVIKMFAGDEADITFIVRKEQCDTLPYLRGTLQKLAPLAQIFEVDKWEKRGPVMEVLRASDIIEEESPYILCYCDFYMRWDYEEFKREVFSRGCEGAVPCYTGFHPHLLPEKNLYASCLTEDDGNLREIREKFSFNPDKDKALHSPGVYYFKSGRILKKYCAALVEANDSINGEFYASLPYNYMVKDGLTVWCPANVFHFCQWGTPEDLREYLFWTEKLQSWTEKELSA